MFMEPCYYAEIHAVIRPELTLFVTVNSLHAWHCLLGCGNEIRSDYGYDVTAFLVEGQHIHKSLWSALNSSG